MSASRAMVRPSILVALLLLLVPVGIMVIPPAPLAAVNTITVNTLSDSSTSGDGSCSLREAINNANSPGIDTTGGDCALGTGNDTVVFSVSGTITLGGTLPTVANTSGQSLTIDGSGKVITVDGAGLYQVLQVNPGATLSLNGLTIAHGNQPVGDYAGGITNLGTLTVTNSTFSANQAGGGNLYNGGYGGAIYNGGILTVTNSTFLGNSVFDYGGGIYNDNMATVINSTFSYNVAGGWGGAIYHIGSGTLTVTDSLFSGNSGTNGGGGGIFAYGTVTVTNSTFSGNLGKYGAGGIESGEATLTVTNSTFSGNSSSYGSGGGIWTGVSATVTNSTFSGNSAYFGGGGIFQFSIVGLTTLTVTNSTFSGNSSTYVAGGDIYDYLYGGGSTLTINNSILASSTSGGNCGGGPFANSGYNISDDDSCGFGTSTGANGDTIGDNVDPLLDSSGLQNNGGPTETIALEPKSPAIDAIPVADCPATDQRGAPRPDPGDGASGPCDIGALESGNLAWLAPSELDFGTVKIGQSSAASSVTLTNGAGKQIKIKGTAIGADFQVVSTTCSSTLSAGQSCEYQLSFQPRRAATKNEKFRVTVTGASLKVQLQGVGVR